MTGLTRYLSYSPEAVIQKITDNKQESNRYSSAAPATKQVKLYCLGLQSLEYVNRVNKSALTAPQIQKIIELLREVADRLVLNNKNMQVYVLTNPRNLSDPKESKSDPKESKITYGDVRKNVKDQTNVIDQIARTAALISSMKRTIHSYSQDPRLPLPGSAPQPSLEIPAPKKSVISAPSFEPELANLIPGAAQNILLEVSSILEQLAKEASGEQKVKAQALLDKVKGYDLSTSLCGEEHIHSELVANLAALEKVLKL